METEIIAANTIHAFPYSFTAKEEQRKYRSRANSKILVVEDNHFAAQVLSLMLKNLKCDTDVAVNGEEALKLFQRNTYDLVFMDIGLPDVNGYEVTRRMRVMEKGRDRHTPIIALSAHIDLSYRQACLEAGMDEVLTKPLFREKAVEILSIFINSKYRQ